MNNNESDEKHSWSEKYDKLNRVENEVLIEDVEKGSDRPPSHSSVEEKALSQDDDKSQVENKKENTKERFEARKTILLRKFNLQIREHNSDGGLEMSTDDTYFQCCKCLTRLNPEPEQNVNPELQVVEQIIQVESKERYKKLKTSKVTKDKLYDYKWNLLVTDFPSKHFFKKFIILDIMIIDLKH